jgi:hypothetical protein
VVQEFEFMPVRIDRNIELSLLPGDVARRMEWIDVAWLRGRMRRAAGEVGMQIGPNITTTTNAFVGVRRDGRKVVYEGTDGEVWATVGNDTQVSLGPTNEWGDDEDFGERLPETDDIDDGIGHGGGGGCGGCV